MKIVIPNFKCPSLNKMYAGRHWKKRKDEADYIHKLVQSKVEKGDFKPPKTPIDIKYIAYFKYKHKRDPDNLAVKFITDGLVLAGLIEDDSCEFVRWVSSRAVIGAENDRVEIEIKKV